MVSFGLVTVLENGGGVSGVAGLARAMGRGAVMQMRQSSKRMKFAP